MNEEVVQDSEELEVTTLEDQADDSPQVENEVVEPSVATEEYQDRNFAAMRQRQKEMELDNQRKDDFIAKLLEAQKQPEPVQQVEPEEQIDPEDYPNYGGVQKVTRKTVQPLEDKINKLEGLLNKQAEQKRIDTFKSKYPDFDDVVNVETLELLEKKEPELAKTIASCADPFQMGLQSYKYIKAMGLVDELPTARRVKEVDKKLESNAKATQSPQAYDKRPMAKAFKTTAADDKRIYEEMMGYASQAQGL